MRLEPLSDWNTHWGGAPISPLVLRHPQPRAAVPHMLDELWSPRDLQWSLRPGPRQIGKTTSLGHVAAGLLSKGAMPHQVIIAPMDQPGIQDAMGGRFEALIDAALDVHPATRERPLYLLVDEIQDLERWDQQLKAAWDRYHDNVRLVATGSSALRLAQTTGASLANRIRITRMFPMKYREVLESHTDHAAIFAADAWTELTHLAKAARTAFLAPRDALRATFIALHRWLAARRDVDAFLRSVFLEHCVWGGYPAARAGSGTTSIQRLGFFEAAWGSITARDLPHAGVRDVRGLERMFRTVGENTGGKFVPANVAKRTEVKSETVVAWKRLLEELVVVQQLPPLKPNLRPAPGKDKAYLVDPGWFAYWWNVLDHAHVLDRPEFGVLLETVLVDHLRRLLYNLTGTTAGTIGYVVDPEIDICLQLGRRWVLVECKSSGKASDALRQAGARDDIRITASRSTFALDDDTVWTIPAHVLAFVC